MRELWRPLERGSGILVHADTKFARNKDGTKRLISM